MFEEESAKTGVLHEKIAEAPKLPICLQAYWESYLELGGSRHGSEAIPVSEIHAFCLMFGIEDAETKHFLIRFINALTAELAEYNEKQRQVKNRLSKLNRGK